MPQYPSQNQYQPGQPAFLDPGAQLYSSPVSTSGGAGGNFAFSPAGPPSQAQFPAFYGAPHAYFQHQVQGGVVGPPQPHHQQPINSGGASSTSPTAFVRTAAMASPSLGSPGSSPFFPSPPPKFNNYGSPNGGIVSVTSGMNAVSSSPPAVRRPVLSLRPPVSPTASRGGASPVLSASGSAGFREREEKKRRINVKLPWELWEEGEDAVVGDETEKKAAGRKRSTMSRRPLDDDAKRRRIEEMEDSGFESAEATTRERHFDEERLSGLPPSIDVYLPGQESWDDLRQAMTDEKLAQLGYTPNGPDLLSSRLNSYIETHNAWPSSSNPPPTSAPPAPSHFRTGSLFHPSSLIPPRLQQVYDSISSRGRPAGMGHGSSFSMGGPLAKSFTMPTSLWGISPSAAPESVPLPSSPAPEGLSPRPGGRDSGYFGSPGSTPPSKDGVARSATLSKERGRRLTLAELSRGFGIEEEDEGEEEPRQKRDIDEDDEESRPSLQMSGQSNRTGVASGSDDISDVEDGEGEEVAIVTNPSDEEQGLPAPQGHQHVHRPSLGTAALAAGPDDRLVQASLVQEGQYGGSDSGQEPGDDGELSDGEYSNPSDEDRARAQRRRRREHATSWDEERTLDNSMEPEGDSIPVGLEEESEDVLFQAPADIDAEASRNDRQRPDFHFPPRGPLPAPPTLGVSRSSNSLGRDPYEEAHPPFSTLSRSQSAAPLNVGAPEFVFGSAKPLPSLTPTFGRSTSTTSLGSAGFAPSIGAPGSIAEGSLPPSPTKSHAVLPHHDHPNPHLNPFAGEFKPTFDFKLPAEAPVLPPTPTSSTPSVRNTPSVRGPLPPVPLVQTVASHVVKRMKVESQANGSDDDEEVVPPVAYQSSPGKDNVRGFKFPSGEGSPSQRTLLSGGSPLQSSPTTRSTNSPHNDGAHSLNASTPPRERELTPVRIPFITESRPFTLSGAAVSISPDGRVIGFSPVAKRSPIPNFGSHSTNDEGEQEREERRRRESMDDINLPSISRPRSRAMPVPHSKKLLDYGVPKWISDAQAEEDEDIFGSDAMPLSPNSEQDTGDHDDGREQRSQGEEDLLEDEEDDSPLRILEAIIDRQFDSLREELSGFTSLKADLDALKHDALIDSLIGRMEAIMTDSRNADGDARIANLSNVREAVENGNRRVQDALLAAVEELKSAQAHAPTPANLDSDKSGLDPSIWIASLESQRTQVVAAVSDAVKTQLATGVAPTIDLTQLSAVLETAIAPLRDVVTAKGPQSDLDAAVAAFEKATSALEERAIAPPDTHKLSLELETAIETLQKAALEQSAFPSRVAASVQPLVAGIFSRLADRSDAGDKVVERIIPTLELIAEKPVLSAQELSAVVCAQLGPLLAPLVDLALLPAQVARAVSASGSALATSALLPDPVDIDTLAERIITELREGQPLASLTTTSNVAKLVEGQEQLDGRTSEILNGQISLAALVDSLRADVSHRFDETHRQLEEHASLVTANNALTAQVSDVESQLAKARNEHGKARSEKAALSERVEAERATLVAEALRLKEKLHAFEESDRSATVEHGLIKQTNERLEDELREARVKIGSLEDKLASARAHQEAWHDTELKHISTLAELQASRRTLEADAQTSSNETTRLRSELAELRTAHEGLSSQNQKLSSELQAHREAAATTKGEVAALEKRISGQDDKIGNLQRVSAAKQQALALANQRASELDKRTAELADARTQIVRATETAKVLESQVAEKEASAMLVLRESDAFRERMAQDLEAMKETVAKELQQKADELVAVQEDHERLRNRTEELTRQLELANAANQHLSNGFLPTSVHPTLHHPTPRSYSPYPPAPVSQSDQDNDVSSSMWAPTPRAHVYPPATAGFLEPQHTGSTIHRPSSTASRATNRSAKSLTKAADGWWS
ncbi:hypothetical protein RQP46_003383 [Phenoliferia psychrophenolica]